jgi:hypothetical protein
VTCLTFCTSALPAEEVGKDGDVSVGAVKEQRGCKDLNEAINLQPWNCDARHIFDERGLCEIEETRSRKGGGLFSYLEYI